MKDKVTIHLWYGSNTYELYTELTRWKKVFSEKYSDLNTLTYTQENIASGTTVQLLTQSVQSTTLFGDRTTFIILKNILSAKKLSPEITHAIESVLTKPSPDTFILFYQSDKIENKELYTTIEVLSKKNKATIKEFLLPETSQALAMWINAYAKQKNINISLPVLKLIIQKTTDLETFHAKVDATAVWSVVQELHKISTYAGNKAITEKDVMSLETTVRHDELWNLLSAIIAGNSSEAAKMFESRLLSVPTQSHPAELRTLLTLLAGQVTSLRAVKLLSGPTLTKYIKDARWTKGRQFMVTKQANALSKERLTILQNKIVKLFDTSVTEPKLLKAEFSLLLI
jgi:DNA polymerase III delta subunit